MNRVCINFVLMDPMARTSEDQNIAARQTKALLGEKLLEGGLINEDQLQQVLRRQAQVSGRSGSLLNEMGFVATNDQLDYSAKKAGASGANLFDYAIDEQVLKRIPLEKISAKKVLPLAVDANGLTLAMVNPHGLTTIAEIEFRVAGKVLRMGTNGRCTPDASPIAGACPSLWRLGT